MKRHYTLLFVCAVLLTLGTCLIVANACQIEAVINWKDLPIMIVNPHHPLAYIHERGWDGWVDRWSFGEGPIETGAAGRFSAWDYDIFVPPDNHSLGNPVWIKCLCGLVAGTQGEDVEEYDVWRWVDVNNNGDADPDDKIYHVGHGFQVQNWELIAFGPVPDNCRHIPAKVFNLFRYDSQSRLNVGGVAFYPGLS